jgi:hypothetical protein
MKITRRGITVPNEATDNDLGGWDGRWMEEPWRSRIAAMHQRIINDRNRVKALETQNQHLKKYIAHPETCDWWQVMVGEEDRCSCGLGLAFDIPRQD